MNVITSLEKHKGNFKLNVLLMVPLVFVVGGKIELARKLLADVCN